MSHLNDQAKGLESCMNPQKLKYLKMVVFNDSLSLLLIDYLLCDKWNESFSFTVHGCEVKDDLILFLVRTF